MRTHSYCLGCKYSLQMYLKSSSSSSTAGRRCNSVLLTTCAEDKHSSQSKFPVIPDIPSRCLRACRTPAGERVSAVAALPTGTLHCAVITRFTDANRVTLISPLPTCATAAGSCTSSTDYCSDQGAASTTPVRKKKRMEGGAEGWRASLAEGCCVFPFHSTAYWYLLFSDMNVIMDLVIMLKSWYVIRISGFWTSYWVCRRWY